MMRMLLVACALALPAGLTAAQSEGFPLRAELIEGDAGVPVPAINVVIVQDGAELSADTTDAAGFAEFPAGEAGEHTVNLQDPAPVDAVLLVVAARQEWSSEVKAGDEGPAILFPAEAGEMVQLWLVTRDQDYVPAEPGEPVEALPPPVENTHAEADVEAAQ